MLIRLLELNLSEGKDEHEDAKFLAAYKEPNFDAFVKMLKAFKDSGEEFHIAVDGDWYMVDTYVFSFPKNDEFLPCINIYVF